MTVKKGLELTGVELTAQLQGVHDQLLEGMRELISRKDYSTAEQIFRLVEKQLNGLIEKLSASAARSSQYAETDAVPRS
jgi:hypothetical protein